ncbi:snRNA-activating protein complex subunit 4 isoform X2 [Hyperolius riggenbachi]|uniref:snRNA-activating protein complex subunit 4 isoform X2 n=1 Tax=Hyperolius riggenbachi TaxID=752182 RepID=UPI0035A356D4
MAAGDLKAEREKIQREIEELERNLGQNAAEIDVEVSDSSDDSDDDPEDQLDEDIPADDLIWEDGGSSAERCLQMNLVYQAVIQEKLQELDLLIAQNKEQQDELMWELVGRKTQRAGASKPYPLNLAIGHFLKPYFKDKVTYVGPPANQEMMERNSQIVKGFECLVCRKWRSNDKTELRKAIMSDTLQRLLQPKLLKLEYLQQKRDNTQNDIDKKLFTKQIQEAEREIDEINQLSEEALLGRRSDPHDWDKISNINFEGRHRADRLSRIWQNYEHPLVNKEDWSKEEIEKLQEIANKHNFTHWNEIAEELGTNRAAFQCLRTYLLNSKGFKRREFSKEEDEMLTHFVQRMRIGDHIPYNKISYFMEGRDGLQLLFRWSKSLDPNIKKGPWTKEEDEWLLRAVEKYGEKEWYKIRWEVPGRSDIQCRERYVKALHKDVKKGRWSQEESKQLLELTAKYGVGKWAKVSREIPHRTGSQCHSRWKNIHRLLKRKEPAQEGKPLKRVKKELQSDDDTSVSSGDYNLMSSSSDSEDEAAKRIEESEEDEIFSLLHPVPDLALWVPKKYPTPPGRTLIVHSFASTLPNSNRRRNRRRGKREQNFQFNTVLKGIAYPASTDTVTENVEDFLREMEENEQQVLLIWEEDIFKILTRNTKETWKKQIQRLRQRQGKPATEAQTNQQEDSSKSLSRLYKTSIDRKLLYAVSGWIGNIFLPLSTNCGRTLKRTHAEEMSKRLRGISMGSTPMFILLIQFFQIDAVGCLRMIHLRRVEEAELKRNIVSCAQGMQPVPMSLQSPLAQPFNVQSPADCGVAPAIFPRRPRGAPVRNTPPPPAPKTVAQLLMEKRMGKSNAAKGGVAIRTPNISTPPQNVLLAPSQNVILAPSQNIVLGPSQNAIQQPQQTILLSSPTITVQNVSQPLGPLASLPSCQVVGAAKIPTNQSSVPVKPEGVPTEYVLIPQSSGTQVTSQIRPRAVAAVPISQPSIQKQPGVTLLTTPNYSQQPVTFLLTSHGLIQVQTQALSTKPTVVQNSSTAVVSSNSSAMGTSIIEPRKLSNEPSAPVSSGSTLATTPAIINLQVAGPSLPTSTLPSVPTLPAIRTSVTQGNTPVTSSAVTCPQVVSPHSPTVVFTSLSTMKTQTLPVSISASAESSLLPVVASSSAVDPPSLTLPNIASSLKQENMVGGSHSQPAAPCLPKPHPRLRLPNKANQITHRLETYHIARTANPPNHGNVNLASGSQPRPTQNTSAKRPSASDAEKALNVKLISFEEEPRVKEWIQGKGSEGTMSYLPPSICTLKTFSRLLLQKEALELRAAQLVPPVGNDSGPSQEAISKMVEERLQDNPAYRHLKGRFLSAFTFPGFLSVLPPTATKVKQEDSDDDLERLWFIRRSQAQSGPEENLPKDAEVTAGSLPGTAVPSPSELSGAHCTAESSDDLEEPVRIVTQRSAYWRPTT